MEFFRQKRLQAGMTLLEVVIGITLAMMIMIFAFEQFMPWLNFRQKFMTELHMNEVQKSLESAYTANSFYIDSKDESGSADYGEFFGTVTTGGKVYFGKGAGAPMLETGCEDETLVESNRSTLSKILGNSNADFGKDGYDRDICVVVTRANIYDTGAVKIYYHTILLISRGKNGELDTQVNFGDGTFKIRELKTGETEVFNDDIVRVVNGYHIQQKKFELALKRLEQTSKAFENYFQLQFLTDVQRDLLKNYFTASATKPNLYAPLDNAIVEIPYNGPLFQGQNRMSSSLYGEDVQQIWVDVFSKLGLALEDVKNPWITCGNEETQAQCENDFMLVLMSPSSIDVHADLVNAGVHGKIRSPNSADIWFQLPPYNVIFALDYPGRLDDTLNPGSPFLLKSAQSKY